MFDPREGLTPDGMIRTGAAADRIPPLYRPFLDGVLERIALAAPDASSYLYGSVAAGLATQPRSDIDLLTIGLPADLAHSLGDELSTEFSDVCRRVEIAAAGVDDFNGDSNEAYGNRVFLHHYCVLLTGADRDRAGHDFPGDQRAARGFNGDISRHLAEWRRDAEVEAVDAVALGRRIARKTLLAVAGLVSVHDSTWTTDRNRAATRWAEVHPNLEPGLLALTDWSGGRALLDSGDLELHLYTTVDQIVHQFTDNVGLWTA
jgi:hypothetical protein